MSPPQPPPIRRGIDARDLLEAARRAIDTVSRALPYIVPGPIILHRGPAGEVHVDIPLLYQGMALDKIHFDPGENRPSPKGRPIVWLGKIDLHEVREIAKTIVSELRVLGAAEYREPEAAWIVPLAWGPFIVAHIKVSSNGDEIIPDYGLTRELRRMAP
ncbi:hypothetical protein PYJP_11060 [Pyrofollis japonicus]|uniref:hypothetical protein n=1 Tax=Pyrofollis japonicus TaxID=3060460 RepID=UPI00295AF2CF|nr:hypothetical protein [Pyrofollis japonicus]BEP17754.1 hypothetical protein PYJP_11060 [Pyrofollis japonicus]